MPPLSLCQPYLLLCLWSSGVKWLIGPLWSTVAHLGDQEMLQMRMGSYSGESSETRGSTFQKRSLQNRGHSMDIKPADNRTTNASKKKVMSVLHALSFLCCCSRSKSDLPISLLICFSYHQCTLVTSYLWSPHQGASVFLFLHCSLHKHL